MAIRTAAIFSILGNPNSLVPLGIKDLAGTAGMTAGSMATGKEEGIDRFIDEAGTEIIWLFGIPLSKALFNKTAFKALNFDYKYDPRNLKNNDIFEKTKEFAPTEKIKQEIDKIGKKQGLFKNTVSTRFVFSTALTIASYIMLTKFKQKYTEKQIRQNLIKEYNEKKKQEEETKNKEVQQLENDLNPAFKGIGPMVEHFAFSPVRNMYILEGAITATRLKDSRSPQEFIGYGIKETAMLTFLYYAGGKIQKLIEESSKKKYNKSISLDARVLEDNSLQKIFDDGSVIEALKEFKDASSTDVGLYEFIHKNPENVVVKYAKESDIIELYKEPNKWYQIFKKKKVTDKIDTRKYIDLKDLRELSDKLNELYGQYKDALLKGETSDMFFAGLKKLKRKSVIANIGISCLALGVITPALMLGKRLLGEDDTEFETKKRIREQLIEEGLIA